MAIYKPLLMLKTEPETIQHQLTYPSTSPKHQSKAFNQLPTANAIISESRHLIRCCAHEEELNQLKSESYRVTELLMRKHIDEMFLVSSQNTRLLENEKMLLNENRALKESLKKYEEYVINFCSANCSHSLISPVESVNHNKRTSDASHNENWSKRLRIEDVDECYSDEEFFESSYIHLFTLFFHLTLYEIIITTNLDTENCNKEIFSEESIAEEVSNDINDEEINDEVINNSTTDNLKSITNSRISKLIMRKFLIFLFQKEPKIE